jgi:transformation/transcription domain-associated protein
LLPSAANLFLENFVKVIVQTEAQMHFSGTSPFSEPLAKYLNRYVIESVDFFMGYLQFPRYLRTLRSILQAKLAPNLQRELVSRTSFIVSHCLKGHDQSLVLPGLLLFSDLSELIPTWIAENGYVIDALLDIWRSEQPQPEISDVMVPDVTQRHTVIMSIFLAAMKQSARIDLLFDIISIYTRNLAMDTTQYTRFLYRHVALSDDLFFQRNVLMRFLTWFEDPTYTWSHKSYFIRFIVSPTLLVHATRSTKNEGLLDIDFVNQIHRSIWHPMIDDTFVDCDDVFKIELLHLTTVLVHHYSNLLEDVKKDIIKCAWHYITSDDIIVQQTAYLLAARFFEAFETPQKFILRAWTGLLRPLHSEGRSLIRRSLEILAPILPRSNTSEVGYPQWAIATRRLLTEEGNGFPQIIVIYQLIVRQPRLFFPVRALFIPHMVNSLSKLGLSVAASHESRLLSIDILQVIFDWEQDASNPMDKGVNGSPNEGSIWVTPIPFRETAISYLVRLSTTPPDAQSKAILIPRALALLQRMAGPKGWNDVAVGLRFFSRALEQVRISLGIREGYVNMFIAE